MVTNPESNTIYESCDIPIELQDTAGQQARDAERTAAATLIPSSVAIRDTPYDLGPSPDGAP